MIEKLRQWLEQLLRSVELPTPEVAHRLARVQAVERNLVLPLKAFTIGIILYSLHLSPWFGVPLGSMEITVTTVNTIFAAYVALSLLSAVILLLAGRFPFAFVQWTVFTVSLVDGIFISTLTLVSGGYDSPLFWLFVLLIIRNAASTPPLWSQLVLNLCVSVCFAAASLAAVGLNAQVAEELRPVPHIRGMTNLPPPVPVPLDETLPDYLSDASGEGDAEAIMIRWMALILLGVWLYGLQVLLEKQRLAAEEAREFNLRENQLRSAGRMAAEFAHQIKNPLAIVNNAAFSLERGLSTGKGDPKTHLRIIKEEVERADRIITQVMGYAELTEGRVEKLDLESEIKHAAAQAFPEGLATRLTLNLSLAGPFPPMLMQRRHLSEAILNLLQNAREALGDEGRVTIAARVRRDLAVEITVTDDGPGIPPEKLERIFEAYFTTKQRGTGLGLAIVKNNVELYGGTVRAESELGKGACFTLVFPLKASMKIGS